MKRYHIFNRSLCLGLVGVLMGFLHAGESYAQKNKTEETGEIVMTREELESLLTKIAERRKKSQEEQSLRLPAYPQARIAYQDQGVYPDLRTLQYKLDLLLYQSNLVPRSPGNTTVNVPSSSVIPMVPSGTANNREVGTREVLKGHPVFFANNSTTISVQDRRAIADLVPLIQERKNEVLVVLKGYASQVGNAYYNNQLSFKRADAVKQLLISRGVNPGNIMILYHGADSTLKADEARRVEIILELTQ